MSQEKLKIERIQTGIRLEKRLLKVLKGTAEFLDLSVFELVEIILLHSFENQPSFSKEALKAIKELKKLYCLDYDIHSYKKFQEIGPS